MTHIIMSGLIKPLTEAERHFAKLKLRKIRAGEEEPQVIERPLLKTKGKQRGWGDYAAQVVIEKRLFVTVGKAAEMLGYSKRSIGQVSNRQCWETRRHPEESRACVFAMEDVFETLERKRKRKRKNGMA